MGFEGLAVGPAGGPQGGLIEHVEGGAVALGQAGQVTAAHLQPALGVEGAADRRQVAVGTLEVPLQLVGAGGFRAGRHRFRGQPSCHSS